jgi:electron transport complex protein RnfB
MADATAPSPTISQQLLAARIDAVLPQTQCTKCGYPGCRPYAEAIARAEAEINRCPPGGAAGIAALAAITGRRALPLDPACGVEQPLRVAVIDEALCIGCTLCIQACPVDAIVGAARRMHTVLPHLCTGCDLCVAPCPMDCIEMVPVAPPRAWTRADADAARDRYEKRRLRLAREAAERTARHDATEPRPTMDKRAIVAAAIERARRRRQQVAR